MDCWTSHRTPKSLWMHGVRDLTRSPSCGTSRNSDGHTLLDTAETETLRPASNNSERKASLATSIWKTIRYNISKPFLNFQRFKRQSHYHGWQWGVMAGMCSCIVVLVINVALVIVGFMDRSKLGDCIATLLAGSAYEVQRTSTILHVAINILSTLLLSASNYTMQVLSSPTQAECIRAHERDSWLDVGIPSLRNVRYISPHRRLLWFALALSPVPLHLL